MHGRTVSKELDPGRYLRWIRAGIAAVSIDLPGHGERYSASLQHPRNTLDVLEQMVGEIDPVIAGLRSLPEAAAFDTSRMAIGGMSAGGMAALRRLCKPHSFTSAAVEGTTGWLAGLYFPEVGGDAGTQARWAQPHAKERVAAVDPSAHLEGFRPIPLLALHSESDRVIPVAGLRRFLDALTERYRDRGADPGMIELKTWPETGAPEEHNGFGRVSNDAKNAQVEFLARTLGAVTPAERP